jgi:hypothetical protein
VPCLLSQDKAHQLGDIIVRQEAQTKELQRQLGALEATQAAALAAATGSGEGGNPGVALTPDELAALRRQLVLAQAQLRQQSEQLEGAQVDYQRRQALLKDAAGAVDRQVPVCCLPAPAVPACPAPTAVHASASTECGCKLVRTRLVPPGTAGAARREVLALQDANRELQALADRLQQQNEALGAQLRAAREGGGGGAFGGPGSAGPSPAKRHIDSATLQAMLRKQDGCGPTTQPCIAWRLHASRCSEGGLPAAAFCVTFASASSS